MTKLIFSFILLFSLLSCSKKEEVKNKDNFLINPYIISKEDREYEENLRNSKLAPPPKKGVGYGTNNFIIDKEGNVFYYQYRFIMPFCSFGMENDTIPHFIDLKPEHIIQIPESSINSFIELNYKKDFRNFTQIASQIDTLNSKKYFALVKAIANSTSDKDVWFIRYTRQEEDSVLHYKKINQDYYSEEIKWDKTKIKFRN